MTLLMWEKPAKIMSTKEWENISADGAPPGVYRPNMSHEDMHKWKAKKVGHRVEIRKTTTLSCTQILIKVTEDEVTMSMNGAATLSNLECWEMYDCIREARAVLYNTRKD